MTWAPAPERVIHRQISLQMTAAKVDLASLVAPSSDSFKTDSDISGQGGAGERNLQAVAHEWVSGGDMGALEDEAHHEGSFDQFKTNQRLTGKTAEFRESDYTTQLDRRDFTPAQQAQAARVARSILGTASSNMHLAEERGHAIRGDMDEEARYSGVLVGSGDTLADRNAPSSAGSPGKYVAPGQRSGHAASPKQQAAKTHKATKAKGALNFRAALGHSAAPTPAAAPGGAPPKALSAADMEAHMQAEASAASPVASAPMLAPSATRGANIEEFKAFSAGFDSKVAAKMGKKTAVPAAKAAAAPAPAPSPQASAPAPDVAATSVVPAPKPKKKLVFNVNAKPFDFDMAPPASAPQPQAPAQYYGGGAAGGMVPPGSMGYSGGYATPPQYMQHPGAIHGYGMPHGGAYMQQQQPMGGGYTPGTLPQAHMQQPGRPPAFIPHTVPLPGAGMPYNPASAPPSQPASPAHGNSAARLAQASIAQSASRSAPAGSK